MGFLRLDPTTGPPCPHCGCTDSEIDRRRRRWGSTSTRLRCRNCGVSWYPTRWGNGAKGQESRVEGPGQERSGAEPPSPERIDVSPGGAVLYCPVRCPKCASAETKVTSTRRPVRHHKCTACGERFKSVEQ